MPSFRIECTITLAGAEMIVDAETPEEAIRKAKANEWDNIHYNAPTAELIDWEITGHPKEGE